MRDTSRFEALDAWRGCAALLVAIYHLSASGHFLDWPPVRHGGVAVMFFFVLSGFVMAHAYGERLRTASDFAGFAIRRFGRLYPLHLFTLGLLVLLEFIKLAVVAITGASPGAAPFSGSTSMTALIGNLALANGLGFFDDFTWNGPSWSISTEFYTYFIFAALCLVPRLTPALMMTLVVISGAFLWFNDLSADSIGTTSGTGLAMTIYGFFTGVLSYAAYRELKRRAFRPGSVVEWGAAAIFLACVCTAPPQTFGAPLFAAVVVLFAFQSGQVSAILRSAIPQHLGKISYSIYLIHYPIIASLNGVLRLVQQKSHVQVYAEQLAETGGQVIIWGGPWVMDLLAVCYLALVIAAASITYRFVEEPGRKYFNEIARRREARAQTSATAT